MTSIALNPAIACAVAGSNPSDFMCCPSEFLDAPKISEPSSIKPAAMPEPRTQRITGRSGSAASRLANRSSPSTP